MDFSNGFFLWICFTSSFYDFFHMLEGCVSYVEIIFATLSSCGRQISYVVIIVIVCLHEEDAFSMWKGFDRLQLHDEGKFPVWKLI